MNVFNVILLYLSLVHYPTIALLLFLSSTGERRRFLSRRFRMILCLYFLVLSSARIVRFLGHLDWAISISDWIGTPILLFLLLNLAVGVWQQGRLFKGGT